MAVYYYLAIACSDSDSAAAVSAHFDGLPLELRDRLSISCWSVPHQDTVGEWWSIVRPHGAGINAFDQQGKPEPNLTTREQRSEIGRLLYSHLCDAPDFLYALYGAEALDTFFDVHSNRNLIADDPMVIVEGWEGLVIGRELWERIGRPACYEEFRPGYRWVPYRGESRW